MPTRTAHSEILIQAPIDTVWSVMLDTDRYPQWNPFVEQIDCADNPPKPGSDLTLHVRFGNGKRVKTWERISRLEAPGTTRPGFAALEYVFLGIFHNLNMVRGGRLQTLEAVDARTTRYISHEDLTGWLAWLAPIKQVQDGFDRHAAALKQRCEAASNT